MKNNRLGSMSIEEMWSLHQQIGSTLASKMAQEKDKLEERLRRLENPNNLNRPRRPYPKVLPKYQNQKNQPRNGRAVGSNRIGCRRSSKRAKSWSIFGLDRQPRGALKEHRTYPRP